MNLLLFVVDAEACIRESNVGLGEVLKVFVLVCKYHKIGVCLLRKKN